MVGSAWSATQVTRAPAAPSVKTYPRSGGHRTVRTENGDVQLRRRRRISNTDSTQHQLRLRRRADADSDSDADSAHGRADNRNKPTPTPTPPPRSPAGLTADLQVSHVPYARVRPNGRECSHTPDRRIVSATSPLRMQDAPFLLRHTPVGKITHSTTLALSIPSRPSCFCYAAPASGHWPPSRNPSAGWPDLPYRHFNAAQYKPSILT